MYGRCLDNKLELPCRLSFSIVFAFHVSALLSYDRLLFFPPFIFLFQMKSHRRDCIPACARTLTDAKGSTASVIVQLAQLLSWHSLTISDTAQITRFTAFAWINQSISSWAFFHSLSDSSESLLLLLIQTRHDFIGQRQYVLSLVLLILV